MGKLMEQFWLALIDNIDKIGIAGAFIIVTGVIVFYLARIFKGMTTVIDRISERAELQAQREDAFQTRLLDLHDKTVGNNNKIVELLSRHETAAQERSEAQFIRDEQRLKTLARIAEYLTVLEKTQDSVDNIETAAQRIQGNLVDLQTDLPSLIERKHSETKNSLNEIRTVMQQNYEVVEQTLNKMQVQNEQLLKHMQDDNSSAELRQILKTQTDTLHIVQTVVTNNHNLLEVLITLPKTESVEDPLTAEVLEKDQSHDEDQDAV